MKNLVLGLALTLAAAGTGIGLGAAYAEGGDGCATYAVMTNPSFACNPFECLNEEERCKLSVWLYGPQCDCEGNAYYPFCDISIIEVPGGYAPQCTPVVCPGTCLEPEETLPNIFKCPCQ